MIALLRRSLARLRHAIGREDGSASIEFVIVVPVFIGILFSGIEAGVLMARGVMLERALDISVRDVRLGRLEPATADELRSRICARTFGIADCENALLLELRPIDTATWAGLDDPIACIDRAEDITPATTFETGEENALMLVRACVIVDPVVPLAGLVMSMPRDPSGGFRVAYQTVFVTEPR